MLPKLNRVNQEKEIKRLVKSGKTFFLPQLVIKYLENKEDLVKIGFIISTKVDKKAVVRNLLARRLRKIARELLPELKTGYSILVIAKKPALELSFAELKKQVSFAFTKTKLIKQPDV